LGPTLKCRTYATSQGPRLWLPERICCGLACTEAGELAPKKKVANTEKRSPFDTEDLRKGLDKFLKAHFPQKTPPGKKPRNVGGYKWGVYAFFDYDGEPIYVGQTKEKLSTRIRRHLTNQRTDAVAMSVLDPFEVYRIEVWPLPEFDDTSGKDTAAQKHLNALERQIYDKLLKASSFNAVLNEKDPPPTELAVAIPPAFSMAVVSDEIYELRSHPDSRIARRSLIIARLAQVIAERKVQGGLRRVMLTQAMRLQALARARYEGLGGAGSVETKNPDGDEDSDD
jgi:hypothetical protein